MNQALLLIGIGLVVGVYSGIMGLGGGTIMIPIMVLLLGFTQQKAVATSLAVMLPPVALLAVIQFHRERQVEWKVAGLIALGVVLGAWVGAWVTGYIARTMGDTTLKLIFGFVLTYIAGYTIFQTLGKQNLVRSMAFAGVLLLVSVVFYGATRWHDARQAETAVSEKGG